MQLCCMSSVLLLNCRFIFINYCFLILAKYDNKAVSERINILLRSRDMTKYKLSQATGIGESTLSSYFSRNSKWGIDVLSAIAKYFRVTVDWLINGDSGNDIINIDNSKKNEVPIYGMAICGLPVNDWSEPKDYISVDFVKGLNHVFAVKATGMSMAQTIMPDDIVFAYKPNQPPKSGSIVLASLKTVPDSKEGLIKRIKWLSKHEIMLYSDNARNYEPLIVKESEVYEIFAVHTQIIRQIKQPGQKILI